MREINAAGLALIKEFEGFSAIPYQDPGGVWTIGHGHTRGVSPQTHAIDEEAAEEMLRDDLQIAESEASRLVKVPLTDNQFAALVSLVLNTGSLPLLKTLGVKLNAGEYYEAAEQFLLWNHVNHVVSDGLTKRRQAEKDLFTSD